MAEEGGHDFSRAVTDTGAIRNASQIFSDATVWCVSTARPWETGKNCISKGWHPKSQWSFSWHSWNSWPAKPPRIPRI